MSAQATWARLVGQIEQHPLAAFSSLVVFHALVWTALPTALFNNLPLDVIEGLAYGREWPIGTDKLPPLPWWLLEIAHQTINRDFAYYALGAIAVAVAFVAIWATAAPIVGAIGALAATLIIDGVQFFNFDSVKFDHNVAQLPFWAFSGYAFRMALRRRHLRYWLLLGGCIGLAGWAKYFAIVLAIPLALFVLLDRDARRTLTTPGPWLALAFAIAIFLPHLAWLVQNDFVPIAYIKNVSAEARGILDYVLNPLKFSVSQFYFLLPALLIAAPLIWPRTKSTFDRAEDIFDRADDFDRKIVTVLAFGPALTLIAMAAISGRAVVAGWGSPLWIFLGLWIVIALRGHAAHLQFKRLVALWALVTGIYLVGFMIDYTLLARFDHRYRAASFPGDRFGMELSKRFLAATGRPLRYVVGSIWMGGNVAHYAPEQPRLLIDGNPRRAPWINTDDVKHQGAVIVWGTATGFARPRSWGGVELNAVPIPYSAVAANAAVQPSFDIPFYGEEGTLSVGWAIVAPVN